METMMDLPKLKGVGPAFIAGPAWTEFVVRLRPVDERRPYTLGRQRA